MQFQVVFESLAASTPEEKAIIKEKLIQKFKVPVEKAERMINSAPIVVKKGLSEEQALKYKKALESIGARASIRPFVPQEAEPTERAAEPSPKPFEPATETEPARKPTSPKLLGESGPDFPVFYHKDEQAESPESERPERESPISESVETEKAVAVPLDPYKTQVSPTTAGNRRVDTSENIQAPMAATPLAETETPTRPQPAMPITSPSAESELWEIRRILNPPFDESAPSVTPITTGRVSAQSRGFSTSHPMIEQIGYEEILLLSVFQVGSNLTAKFFIDIFISVMKRPVRLNADLINYNSFALPPAEAPIEQLHNFVKLLLERNRNMAIDMSTYRFLKDKTRIKAVGTDRDIEKYCGKLQSEVEKGLDLQSNGNIVSPQEAEELLTKTDPWAAPPPPIFPPMAGAQPGIAGRPPFPPGAYTTQPMRPPETASPITPNVPPLPQPPQAPYSPQAPQGYSPGYPPQPKYPPPPSYAPPPGYAPNMPPFGMQSPGQAPGRSPDIYPGAPGQLAGPMADQFQTPGFGFANPALEFEINKARDGAQTALILSIVGFFCCFPLSIWGLIKAQDALKVMDTYGVQTDRNKAVAAKVVAIVGLIINALITMAKFLR